MEANIQKYRAFAAAAEYRSFTKAADVLNYTQSTISKMIADLEHDMQLTLVNRNRSGLELTSDGQALLPQIYRMLAAYDDVGSLADKLAGCAFGKIRIGTFSSVATFLIPQIVDRFHRDYPNVEFELLLGDYDEITRWIAEGRVDCGFLRSPIPKEFAYESVESDELVAVVPEDHLLAKQKELDPKQLESYPFLLLERGGRTEVSEFLEEHELHPQVLLTTWEDYAIMDLVERGFGISILHSLSLTRIPYRIKAVPFTSHPGREICLAFRDRRTLSAAAAKFLEYLSWQEKTPLL